MTVRVRGMRRVKVATDGEVHTMAPPLQFSVHERSLQLMVPAPADQVPRERRSGMRARETAASFHA